MSKEVKLPPAKLKIYVWKTGGGEYFLKHSQFPAIHARWGRGLIDYTTDDVLRAKDWKTQKGAERSLATLITKCENGIQSLKANIVTETAKNPSSYYLTRFKDNLKDSKQALRVYKDVTVVMEEIDADAKKKPRISFIDDTNAYGRNGFYSSEDGSNASYCRICGMRLGGLPYFTIGSGYKKQVRVCPSCILEKAQEAEMLLNKLDPDVRKELEAERFLHSMD